MFENTPDFNPSFGLVPFHLGEFPLVTRGLELADIGPTFSEPKTHGEPILNSDSHWQSLKHVLLDVA